MEGKAGQATNPWAFTTAVAYSSLGVALAAVVLNGASTLAMGSSVNPGLLGLAFAGTLAIYTTDRLRDLPRDKITAPERSAFIERFSRSLRIQTVMAGAVSVALGLWAGPRVVLLAAIVAGLGLAHRRLKGFVSIKLAYITLAWTAVAVGLPAATNPSATHLLWVAGIVAGTVTSNVILSNLRDGEGPGGRIGANARSLAGIGLIPTTAFAVFGPAAVRPLILLPLCMAIAVAGFRPSERYGAVVVDGALIVGGLGAWAWLHAIAA